MTNNGVEIAILVFVVFPYGFALLDHLLCRLFTRNFDERFMLLKKMEKQMTDIQGVLMKLEFDRRMPTSTPVPDNSMV